MPFASAVVVAVTVLDKVDTKQRNPQRVSSSMLCARHFTWKRRNARSAFAEVPIVGMIVLPD